tara:strand:+ start:3726 stop:4103 length:378 start_codon:yes stop_codon:yes gene_type:complete
MIYSEPLDNDNYMMVCMKVYDNPQCKGIEEFHEDLDRVKYLKRLFKKYLNSGVLRERLILNHLIILHNVLGPISTRLLFFKLEKEIHPPLKTFLIYLNYLPETLPEVDLVTIPVDQTIAKTLREI